MAHHTGRAHRDGARVNPAESGATRNGALGAHQALAIKLHPVRTAALTWDALRLNALTHPSARSLQPSAMWLLISHIRLSMQCPGPAAPLPRSPALKAKAKTARRRKLALQPRPNPRAPPPPCFLLTPDASAHSESAACSRPNAQRAGRAAAERARDSALRSEGASQSRRNHAQRVRCATRSSRGGGLAAGDRSAGPTRRLRSSMAPRGPPPAASPSPPARAAASSGYAPLT